MTPISMPPIIYGTAWKKAATARHVAAAVLAGFRGIDTACQPKHYHEPGVGEGWTAAAKELGLPREAFWLQTKYTPLSGQDPREVPYDRNAPLAAQVAQSVAASLRNLRTPYLDSLVLHSPLADRRDTLAVWRAMEGEVEAGRVRALGVSNFYDLAELRAVVEAARSPATRPAVVQNRFYRDSGFDAELRAYCRSQGIAYQSFWTLTANIEALRSPVVASLSAAAGLTPSQAMFAFVRGIGITPLTGTTSHEHMQDDLRAVLGGGDVPVGGARFSSQAEADMARALGVPTPLRQPTPRGRIVLGDSMHRYSAG